MTQTPIARVPERLHSYDEENGTSDATMPVLGSAVRHEWALDPDFLTVNHGSYGATPKRVLAAQDGWRRRMERQPTHLINRVLPEALRRAAAQFAAFLGAAPDDLAFVENATVGCNAVLRLR